MDKNDINALRIANFVNTTKPNGNRLATTVYLGKTIKDKTHSKVNDFLLRWLDKDEKIIAVVQANRFKPQVGGLILTNRRLLTLNSLIIKIDKIVDEVLADDALNFIHEKGFGKATKLYVIKKDETKVFIGSISKEDAEVLPSFLPQMSGAPQSIVEKISSAKTVESDAKMQASVEKAHEKETQQAHKKEERLAGKADKQVVKQERKAAELAAIKARGRQLGWAQLTYNGGFGSDYKSNKTANLECYENEVLFKHRKAPITIPANQITGFEITGQKQTTTNSRISVTRMVTLGVFSLAAPKRNTVTTKEAHVRITLKDGRQLFFHTTTAAQEKIHRKLADAISHYSRLQSTEGGKQQPQSMHSVDAAGEILKFAELRKQGLLTDDEFEAKKKQLLGL
ncbi:MAG TPA: SHOCT domain-containing protein [Candidatus Limnocylindria bacterium]|nr:SHOCT domain-containing protein [Candidatus Limnocylindria bacterium]